MMRLEEQELKNIDGQDLYFVDFSQWNEIVKKSELGEETVDLLFKKEASKLVHYSHIYPELSVGVGKTRMKWLTPYLILSLNGKSQRVAPEHIKCGRCDSELFIANPYVFEIYLGVPDELDKFSIMRKADQFPKVVCPSCGYKLDRPAIWVKFSKS
jgi:ribosomal protein L37E